jgi:hypothetical protein
MNINGLFFDGNGDIVLEKRAAESTLCQHLQPQQQQQQQVPASQDRRPMATWPHVAPCVATASGQFGGRQKNHNRKKIYYCW